MIRKEHEISQMKIHNQNTYCYHLLKCTNTINKINQVLTVTGKLQIWQSQKSYYLPGNGKRVGGGNAPEYCDIKYASILSIRCG